MQSSTQANNGPTPVTTAPTDQPLDTGTEAQPAPIEPHAREEGAASEAPVETDTVIAPQENEAGAVVQAVENQTAVQPLSESSEKPGGMKMDSALKTCAPTKCDTNTNSLCDGQKAKKQDKVVRDGRKYVPSKKAMIDPLKMDMSKQLVMPLTSSQLSLQCIECHIIFSDHKSKERHLKLSHPAEYEHCILKNALFACYVCDRHFTNSTELMAHQKAHIEKKPFKCPICGVAFNKSSELTIHKKIHFGQDGYACTDCGKPCKTLTLLKYHRRTHTGERPYVCKECGKRFTMSKALQKHIVSHLPEGAELDERAATAKAQVKKKDGASTVKYSCSICKAIFKTTKTRLHHMKTKHNVLPAAARHALPTGQQVKQNTPIITPISICQPGLLQLEPNGPLQKVDSNIDTEQIRRLIESLGNVQKVNQVVILGQVPPHAPPLELQQIPHLAEPVNISPPQIDFIGQSESKTIELDTLNHQFDPMEQTIILEPITPDGQLENPHFPELGSHITIGESIELTFVQTEQTERHEGEVMHQSLQQPEISAFQSDPVNQMVCQDQNLEQTFILELTPALMPTLELEQSKTLPKEEIPSSSLVPTTELEKTPDQTVIDEQETGLSVPTFMSTVELELTPLQTEQQEVTTCPYVPSDTLTETPSESERNVKEDDVSLVQTESQDLIHNVMDGVVPQEMQEKALQEPFEQDSSEKLLVDQKTGQEQLSEVEDASAPKEIPSQLESKQVPQISELPVNVMSAQELVKVRKRKPARTFIFQGYIQEQVRSIRKDDLQIEAKPPKRQRTKKSHLVVKFGPSSKEKKIKKQKKPSQQHQPTWEEEITTDLSPKKASSQKKGRKGKKEREVGHLVSTAEIKLPSLNQESQEQQINLDTRKKHTRKNKIKKQKEQAREGVMTVSEHKTAVLPVFKKKKQTKIMRKDLPKKAKDGKRKKNLAKKEEVNTDTASAEIQEPHITQDPLVLLKGHKQPQLKVYKLDPSKASSQKQEASPVDAGPMSQQSKDNKLPTSESANNLTAENKKKGGRPKKNQKALSLLSSLQISRQPSETLPTKPKTTRKRKASSKVETEGVITSSHSKRALECKDCGERFSELSSLQKHKATVHIVESPSLTYTNGNIFEGVSRLDLYQLPKQSAKAVGVMNAAADWDTEPEVTELALEDRERTVCFPALIPSPSLPVPPSDVEMSACEDKHGSKTEAHVKFQTSSDGCSLSDQGKNCETPSNFTSESGLNISTQTRNFETGEPLTSDEAEQENSMLKNPSPESEVQATVDEDIKEDLLLEVDLVTVGEQNEKDESDPASLQESVAQDESKRNSECGSTETPTAPGHETIIEKSLTWQTVSCSTHQVEIKEEEEEMVVQRKKVEGKGAAINNTTRGRRRGRGHLKRGMITRTFLGGDTVKGTESEKEQDECQVIYEKHAITPDSGAHDEVETGIKTSQPKTNPECEAQKATAPAACLPHGPPALEESPEEQVVFELESVTTSVEEVMNEGEEHDREVDQSPGIILEKFLTSRQREIADKELCLRTARSNQRQGLDNITANVVQVPGSREIKVEENISDPLLVAPSSQNRLRLNVQPHHQRDIRTVLVKEESTLVLNEAQASHGSRHIRWNVEPVNENENTATPLIQTEETTNNSRITPEFNTNQCIFYPVKEEERELLLGATQTSRGSLTPEGSSVAHQTEHQSSDAALYEGRQATQDRQEIGVRGLLSEPGVSDFAPGQAEADAEWPHPPDLRDFLLRSSDEEERGELSDPQLDSEAEVMAYFSKNKTICARQPDQTSQNLSNSTNQLLAPRDENRTREPIDYFSKYFSWDTWEEIANCTNKLSNMSNPVTAREVAKFVGIHVAMGTLKFPSPRLYWDDLTKVPLIADAVPLSRFLELTCKLKFASPAKDPVNSTIQEERHDVDFQNRHQDKTLPSSQFVISQQSDGESQRDNTNDPNTSKTQTDPLWKVQPLLSRFKAGCQSLRREGDYAVDQYLLPLTGRLHNYKVSLYCTTLIGFGGLLLHVDFKLNLSDKEDAVEKMVPKGSMVFLCKQELSTPAMLERLLVAGVHGAGRVGGARGQIGDEFVSSDGKLMLRRSHCGFILSTAGNGQRSMASLTDNFEKAQMSALLNRDLRNLYPIPLTALAPTCWPQAVLWYLTDLALVNSWLLYRQDQQAPSAPLTLMAFRLEVSKALILSSGSDTQDSVPPQPPVEKTHSTSETPNPTMVEECLLPDAATRYDGSGHWPEQLGEGEGGRCRFGDCQRTSRVLCLKCCVFLCISRNHNCFLNFHNQGSVGKE
ncbi:zinc finger protein 576, tandem duplicate 1 isoform X1 [Paralichthys olivaceus]|uniref:zinc finger protein 576, tandem duplicate 1 isoform X1 n=1 Tax=Paralichthys olivaceus TaxID=8255 RepID=UPI0037520A16